MSYKYTPPVSLSRRERRYQSIKEKILRCRISLLSESTDALSTVLKARFLDIASAIILEHTPEQYEELYSVLIDSARIAHIEIPHSNYPEGEVLVEIESVQEYRRNCSGDGVLQLKMALELLQEEAGNDPEDRQP